MNTGLGGVIWWPVALVLLAIAAIGAGCGDDDADGLRAPMPDAGPAVEPLPLADFCDDRLEAFCADATGCRPCSEGRIDEFYTRQCALSVDSVALGLLTYDAEQAARCVAAVTSAPCNGNFRSFTPPECVDVFEAQGTPGTACAQRSVNQCRDGYCDTREACPGVCVAYRTVDQSCDDEDERCGDDLYCDENICKRRLPEGLSCELASGACLYTLQCLPPEDEGDPATCEPIAAEGEACFSTEQCGHPMLCVDGECALEVESGGLCRSPNNCPEGDLCYALSASDGPTHCQPAIALGAACVIYNSCADGARCVSIDGGAQQCALPGERGDACANIGCMDGLVCLYDEGVSRCDDPQANGVACVSAVDCESGVCRDGHCAEPGEAGDSCSNGGAQACEDNLYCKRAGDGTAVCTAREIAGRSCAEQYQSGVVVCAEGLYCACTLDTQEDCYSGDGEGWECEALRETGAECTVSESCETAICVGGHCRARADLQGVESHCVEEEQP